MADKQDSVKSNQPGQQAGADEEVAMLDEQIQAGAADPVQEGAGQDSASGAKDDLQARVIALEEQLTEAKEQTLRAAAEMQKCA